jgi:hypothetical protein
MAFDECPKVCRQSERSRGDKTPLELFWRLSGAGKPGYGSGYGNPIFVEKSHRKKPANLSNEAATTVDP